MNIDEACSLSVEHISTIGFSDITKEQLERQIMLSNKVAFIDETKTRVKTGNIERMAFTHIQYVLSPKNRHVFDYRKTAIIDGSCLAKYTAIVLMAAETIEKARIPISEEVVFSYRFEPNGARLFNEDINYNAWREKVKELANSSECTYVVQCDIASFYDRVNLHRVESTLQDIGVDSAVSKQLNRLLLMWAKKDSYGLPVGNSASRILAEAALIDIDLYLVSEGVKYIRYVDDFRMFAPNLLTAQRWLNLVATRLFRDGLMLNTGKTKLYYAHKDEDHVDEKATDTAETIIKKVTLLAGGYNRIARTFIMPANDKFEPFKEIRIEYELNRLKSEGLPEFLGIKQLIIACLIQRRFDLLEEVAKVCSEYLYSLDYLVDMLIKNSQDIPPQTRQNLADFYANMALTPSLGSLEWHKATLAALLSSKEYFRKDALINIAKSRNIERGTYPSMIAFEGLKNNLSRMEFKTIREWYGNCDRWEQRRIMNLSCALPGEERKAWGKAIKLATTDDFMSSRIAHELACGREL